MSDPVRVERQGNRATVYLARPEKRNALTTALFKSLAAAMESLDDDQAVRCIVLAAEGPVFSAGQDLRYTRQADPEAYEQYGRWNVAVRQKIQRLGTAVVARVQGTAVGGGVLLATACDLVVAASDATFRMAEIRAGAHAGGYHLFSVGRARSLELSLLGSEISAETAADWGLINRAVPTDELDPTIDEFVETLSEMPPLAVQYTKRAMNLQLDMAGFTAFLEASGVMQRYLSVSPDSREAKQAFLDGRNPVFTGRRPNAGE